MSRQKHDLPGNKLPLPQPRSPQELDDKILAYARQRAPQRTTNWIPRWTSGWTTGLATASVVAIAVFITQTQQSTPSFNDKAQPTAAQRYAEEAILSRSTAPAAAADGRISGQAPAAKKAVQQKMLAERLAAESSAAIATETVADMALAADTVTMPKADAMADGLPRMDQQQLELQLEQSASLLKQGQEAEARAAYQALRRECPGCALPETLDLWLAGQRKDAAPPLPSLPLP